MGIFFPLQTAGGVDTSASPPMTCPASVALRDLVYLTGNDAVDKADANFAGKFPAFAFVRSKPSTTQAVMQYDGELTGFAGLVANSPYYLSETPGAITAVAPTAPGSAVQKVGIARNATTLVIDIDRDYVENS